MSPALPFGGGWELGFGPNSSNKPFLDGDGFKRKRVNKIDDPYVQGSDIKQGPLRSGQLKHSQSSSKMF